MRKELFRTDYIDFSKKVSNIESLNICGIINERVHITSSATKSALLRIPILTPGGYQAVLSLWNDDIKRQPHFAKTWETAFQLIAVRRVYFERELTINNKKIFFLRAASRIQDKKMQFIYLSPPDVKFWSNPISIPDAGYNFAEDHANSWPKQPEGPIEGFLKTSIGSVNKFRLDTYEETNPVRSSSMVRMDELEPFLWSDFKLLKNNLFKALRGNEDFTEYIFR